MKQKEKKKLNEQCVKKEIKKKLKKNNKNEKWEVLQSPSDRLDEIDLRLA